MKIVHYGKNSKTIKPLVQSLGYSVVAKNPDLVISYGGDGTLLASERDFPGVAKLPIRDSKTCIKCPNHKTEHLLKEFSSQNLELESIKKLEVKFGDHTLRALNDIVIRNSTPIHAVRFNAYLNNKPVTSDAIVGDGLVASTPFGSTGYYRSISKKTISKDFALAFNNPTSPLKPVRFNSKDKVTIHILRGPATLSVDNDPKLIALKEGDELEIKASQKIAQIFSPQTLRCQKCRLQKELRLK